MTRVQCTNLAADTANNQTSENDTGIAEMTNMASDEMLTERDEPIADAYLVMLNCVRHDIPLYMGENRGRAFTVANEAGGKPSDELCDIFGVSEALCVSVVSFSQGRPVKREVIKDF